MKITPLRSGLLLSLIGFLVYCVWGYGQIDPSVNSTACVAYFFLPIYAVGALAVPLFVLGFCAHYAVRRLSVSRRCWSGYGCAVVALVLGAWFATAGGRQWAHEREMGKVLQAATEARQIPPSQYAAFLQTSPWRTNKYVLGAFLEHPDLSADMLYQIAQISSPELHQRMDASPTIKGKNRRGLAVMRLVALHPNVDERILALLAQSPNPYVKGTVAQNPKTPVDILRTLATSSDQYVRGNVAKNPSTSREDLEKLVQDPEWYVRSGVLINPKCPQEIKERLRNDPDERTRSYFKE